MFSKPDTYAPTGMFNITHLIALTICFTLVIVGVIYTRKITKEQLKRFIKISAVIITILEIVKITFNIYYDGLNYLNNIIPLHFCSLFIYSLWMVGYGKGYLKKMGESFIVGGGLLAGGFFLIMPSSSFQVFPIFHYQCLYSLLFHSLMLYLGIMYFIKDLLELTLRNYVYYAVFCSIFIVIAFTINEITGCIDSINTTNLMFIREPWGLPLKFLKDIHNLHPYLYSLFIYIAYIVLLYFPTTGVKKLIKNRKESKNSV